MRRSAAVLTVGGILAIPAAHNAFAASVINSGSLIVSSNKNLPTTNPSPSPPASPVDGQIAGDLTGASIIGTTTVNPNVSLTVSRIRQDTLNITGSAGNDSAKVTINPSVPVVGVPAGDDAYVSVFHSINIDHSGSTYFGTLDVTNNDLIIDYTGGPDPLTDIEAMVASAYNGGTWTGKGITSSLAAASQNTYSVAVIDNALRTTPFTTFDGITVPTTSVIVKFTWAADLNFDGVVTTADAVIFAANYSAGDPTTHRVGDLNYNGIFDLGDAVLFAATYNALLPHLPEPATLGLLTMAAPALLMRRRKRHAS